MGVDFLFLLHYEIPTGVTGNGVFVVIMTRLYVYMSISSRTYAVIHRSDNPYRMPLDANEFEQAYLTYRFSFSYFFCTWSMRTADMELWADNAVLDPNRWSLMLKLYQSWSVPHEDSATEESSYLGRHYKELSWLCRGSPSFSLLIKWTLHALAWRGWSSEYVEFSSEKLHQIEKDGYMEYYGIDGKFSFLSLWYVLRVPAFDFKYH